MCEEIVYKMKKMKENEKYSFLNSFSSEELKKMVIDTINHYENKIQDLKEEICELKGDKKVFRYYLKSLENMDNN